jgi:hypothetical protein
MKKLYMVLSLAGVMGAPNLFASMSVITMMDNTSSYSQGVGGEFRAVGNNPGLDGIINWSAYSTSMSTKGTVSAVTDGSSWGYVSGINGDLYFQTFCIEYNEEFTPGNSYSAAISQRAMYGSEPPNGDPISIGTSWLYSRFAAGTLSGYNYISGTGRENSAGALQDAIWWLEDENGGVRNSFIDTAETALYGAGHTGGIYDTELKGNANGAYGVYALNLGLPGQVQDQLVIAVPETSTMVVGALLLLPLGTGALRALRKSRSA